MRATEGVDGRCHRVRFDDLRRSIRARVAAVAGRTGVAGAAKVPVSGRDAAI